MKSQDKFTTPLSRVRGLGSAKSGTEHFFLQRLTAFANLPLSLFLIFVIVKVVGFNGDAALTLTFLKQPVIAIGLILLLLSYTFHMRLGMQIVVEDYVHGEGAKIVLLMLNTLFTWGLCIAGIFSLLKLSFGA